MQSAATTRKASCRTAPLQPTFKSWRQRLRDESGATALEYGLLVTLIATVSVAAMTVVGLSVAGLFNDTSDSFPGNPTAEECEYGWSWDAELG